MNPRGMDDRSTIDQINESTGAGLIMEGRASAGALGGAILARWPDGGQAVITVFHGNRSVARRVATAINELVVAGRPAASIGVEFSWPTVMYDMGILFCSRENNHSYSV